MLERSREGRNGGGHVGELFWRNATIASPFVDPMTKVIRIPRAYCVLMTRGWILDLHAHPTNVLGAIGVGSTNVPLVFRLDGGTTIATEGPFGRAGCVLDRIRLTVKWNRSRGLRRWRRFFPNLKDSATVGARGLVARTTRGTILGQQGWMMGAMAEPIVFGVLCTLVDPRILESVFVAEPLTLCIVRSSTTDCDELPTGPIVKGPTRP